MISGLEILNIVKFCLYYSHFAGVSSDHKIAWHA